MKRMLLLLLLLSFSKVCFSFDFNSLHAYDIGLIDYSVINEKLPKKLHVRVGKVVPTLIKVSNNLSINPLLTMSVTWTESHFQENQLSRKKASGLMQVLPKTKKEIIKKLGYEYNKIFTQNLSSDVSSLELENIIAGTAYLQFLLKKFKNTEHVIIAYNMGPNWLNKKIIKKEKIGDNNKYLNKVMSKISLLNESNLSSILLSNNRTNLIAYN